MDRTKYRMGNLRSNLHIFCPSIYCITFTASTYSTKLSYSIFKSLSKQYYIALNQPKLNIPCCMNIINYDNKTFLILLGGFNDSIKYNEYG